MTKPIWFSDGGSAQAATPSHPRAVTIVNEDTVRHHVTLSFGDRCVEITVAPGQSVRVGSEVRSLCILGQRQFLPHGATLTRIKRGLLILESA